MKVVVVFNGWEKIMDVPFELVRRGTFYFDIMPPLDVSCYPKAVTPHKTVSYSCQVFATGYKNKNGYELFSNNP